ncbi:MAG: trypsin-like peptidase domain-containing protein [Oscillospiraceae bacterium]|nr:trypsin-like peptidase domain-containing protein [Oscillospiraceae bacterium]
MNNENRTPDYFDPWDQGSYRTGSVELPRKRHPLVGFLLVAVVLLMGVIAILGVMNVKLFSQLSQTPDNDMAVSLQIPEHMQAIEGPTETTAATEPLSKDSTITLEGQPNYVENVPQEGGLSLQAIYSQCIDSVVSITTQSSTGTGVVISDRGYIVTNHHVVEEAKQIQVLLSDDRKLQATLVGKDKASDLAVLRVEAEGLVPAVFGDSEGLRVGDMVCAIGDPLGVGLRGTMTNGIISAINRDITTGGRTMTLIQTNAALNSGNSGGPLINCFGQVIGINTMKIGDNMSIAGVEGLGFAIPSVTVKSIVDQLIAQGYVSGRPYLGIQGEEVSQLYQYYYRLPEGLFLTKVVSGSDAQRKGLTEGDILISLDGRQITGPEDLTTVLSGHKVGDQIEAVIFRNNHQYAVTLTVEEAKG